MQLAIHPSRILCAVPESVYGPGCVKTTHSGGILLSLTALKLRQSRISPMASQSVAHSESIAAFIPELELLIAEAMDEWKVPGLAIAVVQNGEVALARPDGHRDSKPGLQGPIR